MANRDFGRTRFVGVALAALALLPGCATPRHPLVLEPVGPPRDSSAAAATTGRLVVYSAFEVHADFTGADPDHRRYTPYRIFSCDGKLVRTVENNSPTLWEGSVDVALTPGAYRVEARANGYGEVTVPVVIIANRTTTVHLEGGSAAGGDGIADDEAVCLPDGRIVGWRGGESGFHGPLTPDG